MVIELKQRAPRVRFKHPVRVVPLDGSPRIYRTLAANLSRKGMFVRMPEPLPKGTKVALSLEAAGQALPFAEAEIAWCRVTESQLPGRFTGFGVRFTSFLNPRAPELVEYLVKNLDRGRPLKLAPRRTREQRLVVGLAGLAGALVLALVAFALAPLAGGGSSPDEMAAQASAAPEVAPTDAPAAPRGASGADLLAGETAGAGPPQVPPPTGVAAPLGQAAAPSAGQATESPVAPDSASPPPAAARPAETDRLPTAPAGARSTDSEAGPAAQAAARPVEPEAGPSGQAAARPVQPEAGPSGQAAARPVEPEGGPSGQAAARPVQPEAGPSGQAAARPVEPEAGPPGQAAARLVDPQTGPSGQAAGHRADRAAAPGAQVAAPPVAAEASSAARAAAPPRVDEAVQKPAPLATAQEPASARTGPPADASRHAAADTSSPGRLALPSGAARALTWSQEGHTIHLALELAPGAVVSRSFLLAGPPRLVLDLDGKAPRKSYALHASAPWLTQVRLGPHGKSTRVVVDLSKAPSSIATSEHGVRLSFAP